MARKRKKEETWWVRTGTAKKGFRYLRADGKEVTGKASLARIQGLVIPPGWTDVHISPDDDRKVQAYGWDTRKRKQYIYSAKHVKKRDRSKFSRVLDYASVLPEMRRKTRADLERPTLDRRKVLATVVRLISRAYFRAGSERYVVQNQTFGITTLRKEHVEVRGKHLVFTYTGKRSKAQRQFIADTPLVEIIQELLGLPGDPLFQYLGDDGNIHRVTATTVNRYLREILGARYSAKDLRTFGATVRAATILADLGPTRKKTEAKHNVNLGIKLVAHDLGNTPAICKKSYIHPAVLQEYELRGRTIDPMMRKHDRELKVKEPAYYPEEAALMRFLQKYG